jgi:hypothetical protein
MFASLPPKGSKQVTRIGVRSVFSMAGILQAVRFLDIFILSFPAAFRNTSGGGKHARADTEKSVENSRKIFDTLYHF